MIYRVIGLMSGSSLDGLDLVFTEFHENAGKWRFETMASACYEYNDELKQKLQSAIHMNACDYLLLHSAYGHFIGEQVNRFIDEFNLHYKAGLVASHGHTSFHLPAQGMTAQLGDGAAIAAKTGLPVVSDLRALDVAFGGQGAPIVPVGEQLLFPGYAMFLNIGGIANISFSLPEEYIAFDICPANRVMNLLAAERGIEFDEGGRLAASGRVHHELVQELNAFEYYKKPYPKSLANSFGTDEVYPCILAHRLSTEDALCSFTEHLVQQVARSVQLVHGDNDAGGKMLVTGGGAFNHYLISKLSEKLSAHKIEVVVPDGDIVKNKEAIVMALIGVLRWRQEYNVLSSVTGASRNSIGGAVWIGQEG